MQTLKRQSQLVQEVSFIQKPHHDYRHFVLVSISQGISLAKVLSKVEVVLVQEADNLLQLHLLLVENRVAAEYLLDDLNAASGQAVWGINLCELELVDVDISCMKAKAVGHRLHLSRKVRWILCRRYGSMA